MAPASHANREALMLQDQITPLEMDILPPPDAKWMFSQVDEITATPARKTRATNHNINLQEDFSNSQFLMDNTQQDEMAMDAIEDMELELDFGMDLDMPGVEPSIEMGRDAPAPRPVEDDMLSDLDLEPKGKHRDSVVGDITINPDFIDNGVRIADDEGDIRMADDDHFHFDLGNQTGIPNPPDLDMTRARISESPLSDISPEFARQVEEEYTRMNSNLYEPGGDDHAARKDAQRARKQRVIHPDEQTTISMGQIRARQYERDSILKPQSFLPRDPFILSLMSMQKNGSFVFNIMREDRSSSWAPELRGLLSVESIIQQPNLKRKRDSGVADLESDQEQGASKSPRLDVGSEADLTIRPDAGLNDSSVIGNNTAVEIAADDGMNLQGGEDSNAHVAAFDETASLMAQPQESGPVSLGTKHAVHLLRDLFGEEAAHDDEKRSSTSVVFQKLLQPKRTTKADATKMFFECLVLATKDAVKVEQSEGTLGGDIRVTAKRGLWGDWAEMEAGGEIATEEQQDKPSQGQNEPEPAVSNAPAVAVEA